MADELSITVSGRFTKNNLKQIAFGASGLTIDVTGKNYVTGTQTVGTANETIALGDVGTPGTVYLYNSDSTNYITSGADSTNQPIKVVAGSQTITGWNGASVNVKANTAACDVQFVIIEA